MRSPFTLALTFGPDFAAWDPPSWSALAAVATSLTAVLAALFAIITIRQNRKSRKAQAQPYVAVFMELGDASPHVIDLVVRNFGSTAAFDIAIKIDPEPKRTSEQSGQSTELVEYPDRIPTLVPRQEWRTLWDISFARVKSELPDDHKATVTFYDGDSSQRRRKKFTYVYDLDWAINVNRRLAVAYSLHDGMKALTKIESTIKKWQEGPGGRGLRVFVHDGEAKAESRRQHAAASRAAAEQIESMITYVPDEEYRRSTGQSDSESEKLIGQSDDESESR